MGVIERFSSTSATKQLEELFRASVFPYPKPAPLVGYLLSLVSKPRTGDIVLDFFAGSCTTAHATLQASREDAGNRRFIMVQLPEPTGRDDYPTIADIGKERIRRVIARMKEENAGQLDLSTGQAPEDLGCRVFKLAPSNYRPWRGTEQATPEAYAEQMELFTDPLVEGWDPRDVIWEVAIKEGYGLNSRIERVGEVESQTVFRVTDPDREQSFIICLDDGIGLEELRSLQLNADTLFVCRDVALNDETAANLALQCRLKTM